ncbi:MAG: DUF362 domain-containing protein [Chloroflexota bacterium]|nr:DUF362 domain-containing protein [Chloroflexota bacterium]
MNRRQFCRNLIALGSAAVLAPLTDACTYPIPPGETARSTDTPAASGQPASSGTSAKPKAQSSPAAAPDQSLATIALVSTTDRAAGVRQALELLGINPVRGRHVLFKPNFNSADPAPGSTHDDVLRILLASLSDMEAHAITLADRSGMGNTHRVMEQKGVFELVDEFGAEAVAFEDLPADAWTIIDGDGFHWARGFPVPRMLRDAECVVQTCNLKTHRYGGHFTLSLKNSVGFVAKHHDSYNFMNELHGTSDQRKMIAEINTAYDPALIVLDGVEAFVKGGPATGTKAETGVILAGTDRVAIDAAGVAILRMFETTRDVERGSVFEQEQLARAVELGLGVKSPDQISFVTGDAESAAYAGRIREVLLTSTA